MRGFPKLRELRLQCAADPCRDFPDAASCIDQHMFVGIARHQLVETPAYPFLVSEALLLEAVLPFPALAGTFEGDGGVEIQHQGQVRIAIAGDEAMQAVHEFQSESACNAL